MQKTFGSEVGEHVGSMMLNCSSRPWTLEDQYDLIADLEAKQMVDILVAQLDILGLDRVKELLPWMLRNAEGLELTREFGQKRNTITTRFYRGMRKAAATAGISWC